MTDSTSEMSFEDILDFIKVIGDQVNEDRDSMVAFMDKVMKTIRSLNERIERLENRRSDPAEGKQEKI